MGHPVTRRLLLSALPVALAGPAALAAGGALAAAPDPLPGLVAAWQRARLAWLALSDDETPEGEALWRERERLAALIRATVATTPAGVLAQLEYMAEDYNDGRADPATNATIFDAPLPFVKVIMAGVKGL